MKQQLLFLFCLAIFCSCNDSQNKKASSESSLQNALNTNQIPDNPVSVENNEEVSANDKYLILEDGLSHIKIGDPISKHPTYLKKAVQENGEGSFPGYDSLDDNREKIGFVFAKYDDESRIGHMEIYAPLYKTKEGIGVGSTFADVKKAYPNGETHGSEIEGRTSTDIGGMSFRLDVLFGSYNIDESEIKPSTKVTIVSI